MILLSPRIALFKGVGRGEVLSVSLLGHLILSFSECLNYQLVYLCKSFSLIHPKWLESLRKSHTFDSKQYNYQMSQNNLTKSFTYNFSAIFSIIGLRPDLYFNSGTRIILLPAILLNRRLPLYPTLTVSYKDKKKKGGCSQRVGNNANIDVLHVYIKILCESKLHLSCKLW